MKSFIGSFVAIFVGIFSIIGGLNGPRDFDGIVGGAGIIIGALAYRSAKRRHLGLRPNSRLRRGIEIGLLVLVFLPAVGRGMQGWSILSDAPISGIFVPLWSLAAYAWISTRKTEATADVVSIT